MPRSLLGISSNEEPEAEQVVTYLFTKVSPGATGIEVTFHPPLATMQPPMVAIAPVQPDRTARVEFRIVTTLDAARRCSADFVELPDRKVGGAILQTVAPVVRAR